MKKQTNKAIFVVLISTLLFSGCASWQEVSGVQQIKTQNITIDLKNEKWHALDKKDLETYNLTKDGILLQNILIKRVPLDKALNSKKSIIPKDILSYELGELIIQDLKVQNEMKSFQVINNKPERIDTEDGVQIIYQIKDSFDNIVRTNSTYFIFNEKLYSINYIAPSQFYYEKDLNRYNKIKKSIKLSLK